MLGDRDPLGRKVRPPSSVNTMSSQLKLAASICVLNRTVGFVSAVVRGVLYVDMLKIFACIVHVVCPSFMYGTPDTDWIPAPTTVN